MMLVDMQVADGLDGHVDQRVTRQLLDHMVEETDPGGDGVKTGAVEVDGHVDLRFRSVAVNLGRAHARPIARRARHAI
jgi:hypothetical protein